MDLSTHFYLFMTIMCLVLTSAKSCNADSLHMDDTVAEKLPEPNESRNLLSTTSHLIDTDETESSRTFGRIKKLQFALLPVMYKLGVMSTIIMLIFFLSLKGVFIGTMLLIMNVIFFAFKIASLKHSSHQQWSPAPQWPGPPPNYWSNQADTKGVHVHIHNAEPVIQTAPVAAPIYEPYGSYPNHAPSTYESYGSYPNAYKSGWTNR